MVPKVALRLRRQPRLLSARGIALLLPFGRARRLLLLAALRASTWLAPAQLPTARRAAVASPRVPVAPQLGVPKFFRWLCERYPQITSQISAKRTEDDYVDNFYLDMNGIIHTCTHGDGVTPNQTTEQMVQKIFEYTERLIKIANPRKVVYLAIDGVALHAAGLALEGKAGDMGMGDDTQVRPLAGIFQIGLLG